MNCFRHSYLILHFRKQFLRGFSTKLKRKLAAKFDFSLDEEISEGIRARTINARHHPGVLKPEKFSLPEPLIDAASRVFAEYPQKSLQADAAKLINYLWSRHPPLEALEYSERLKAVKERIIQREEIDPLSPEIQEEERKRLLDSRTSKVHQRMKVEVYNWKPIDFNRYNSVLYLLARLAPDLATLDKVLSEIKKRDVSFIPITMFDFGSGVGSGMWAVDKLWPGHCKEAVCVDASDDMNTVADELLRGGSMENDRIVRPGGTFFKQFLPMSDFLKYDLVISSHSLFELPSMESRLQTIDVLWRKTAKYLVIIESGTNAGYKLVLEARDYILRMGADEDQSVENIQGHVFSPCPHDKFCPKYLDGSYTPCNFSIQYKPYSFSKELEFRNEVFCYVILKKESRSDENSFPRVVKDPMLRKKHIICHVCTKYGNLRELTATKRKHSKECYAVLKNTKLGDYLPVNFPDIVNEDPDPHLSSNESDQSSTDGKYEIASHSV